MMFPGRVIIPGFKSLNPILCLRNGLPWTWVWGSLRQWLWHWRTPSELLYWMTLWRGGLLRLLVWKFGERSEFCLKPSFKDGPNALNLLSIGWKIQVCGFQTIFDNGY